MPYRLSSLGQVRCSESAKRLSQNTLILDPLWEFESISITEHKLVMILQSYLSHSVSYDPEDIYRDSELNQQQQIMYEKGGNCQRLHGNKISGPLYYSYPGGVTEKFRFIEDTGLSGTESFSTIEMGLLVNFLSPRSPLIRSTRNPIILNAEFQDVSEYGWRKYLRDFIQFPFDRFHLSELI